MRRSWTILFALVAVLLLLGIASWEGKPVFAQKAEAEEPGPRTTTLTVTVTEYEWWLIRWADDAILCRLFVDHEGLPLPEEVRSQCGGDLYSQWITTPPCSTFAGDGNTRSCPGFYLHLATFREREREMLVTLPSPVAYVSLQDCELTPPKNICPTLPSLVITGEEPLPNEQITAIHGLYGETPFTCEESVCILPLSPTPLEGVDVEFWAESSYGDTTERFQALVRVLDTGVSQVPGEGGWYVDVISSQWRGADLASCVRIWKSLPPVGNVPAWLSTPDSSQLLASGEPYYYLAGRLIAQGLVQAQDCPSGGLQPNGYANACGLETARPIVEEWQNQFDARILQVSDDAAIPAQLLKNLFAQESQFWPGMFRVPYEFGLGQITDNGADTILLWNDSFFRQFCPLVLSEDACAEGYLGLPNDQKAILRGALALQASADCAECPAGIDLSNVDFNMSLFAETLRANCEQVGQIVFNATGESPGTVASYHDLWRLTVANYHAGPGCVSYAVHTSWQRARTLDWAVASTQFTEACQGVVPYVDKITPEGEASSP